jgi:hypothetical protein
MHLWFNSDTETTSLETVPSKCSLRVKQVFWDVVSRSLVGIYDNLDAGNSIFIRSDDILSWWQIL